MGVRTLTLWCPDWPVTALRRAGAAPEEGSVVVLGPRGRALAVSAEARAEGVRRGLRRREVEARSPGAVLLAADPALEARTFEAVVRAVEKVTPRMALERPGLLSLPVRGPARYYGGEETAARAVLEAVPEGRVGVAGSGLAARVAARHADPVLVVPPDATLAFLAAQPVDVLEGLDDLVPVLHRLGLATLGALAALPAAAVAARFGADGEAAHRLARGDDPAPPALAEPPPDLTEAMELDPPAERVDTAAFAAKGLADRLLEKLDARGLACTRVAVEAQTVHGEDLSRVWSHDGVFTAAALAQRVRWQLDAWLTGRAEPGPGDDEELTGGLTLLRLVPDEVVVARGRQLGFWGADPRAEERAARVLARLQGMLGHEAVLTPVLAGGRTPAERARWLPWGERRAPTPHAAFAKLCAPEGTQLRKSGEERVWPGAVPPPSPARVYDPALPAELLDASGRPVHVSGRGEPSAPPARLRCPGAGVDAPVERHAGPWLHDVRWWDASRRRRALWRVEAGGVACLVTVERGSAGVEGVYD